MKPKSAAESDKKFRPRGVETVERWGMHAFQRIINCTMQADLPGNLISFCKSATSGRGIGARKREVAGLGE